MEEKEDLRVRRTKKLLSMALLDIMEDTPFNKISVNDICEKAMVHRATFYNHFYDKEDLFNYILGEIQEEMFNKSVESGTFGSSKEMYMDLISNVLDFISENKPKIFAKASAAFILSENLTSTPSSKSPRSSRV